MASLWAQQPSLEFGVKVVRVAGLEPAGREGGTLFVRYYVPAGDGRRRLRVDTREVPCGGGGGGGDAFWGELARFERWGGCGAAGEAGAVGPAAGGCEPAAPGGGLVFELRWRPRKPSGLAALLGTTTGRRGRPSCVLARAELAWRDVAADGTAATSQAPAERWLTLSPEGRELVEECKAPRLLVEVNITHAAASDEVTARRPGGDMDDERCNGGECCGQCGWVGSEDDMFLAATFRETLTQHLVTQG